MDTDHSLLLPSNVLKQQICMECLKYLSVGPVMITKDDQTICGRCVSKHENPTELRKSLFNQVAEACVFSCVNHYDGCVDILSFEETLQHEFVCTGTVYSCPFCSFRGNCCQFKQHCNVEHNEQIIKEEVFKINRDLDFKDFEDDIIYFDIDGIFLIKKIIKCGILKLSVTLLNLLNANSRLRKYHFRFFNPNSKIEYVSDSFELDLIMDKLAENCYQTNVMELLNIISSSPIYCAFILNRDITITLETKDCDLKRKYLRLKQKVIKWKELYKQERQNIMLDKQSLAAPYNALKKLIRSFCNVSFECVNCELPIKDNFSIFVCPQSHICCANCLKSFCNMCHVECEWMNCNDFLSDICLSCNWKNCGVNNLKVHEYLLHKQICKFRQYKCPHIKCTFNDIKAELITHWHNEEIVLKSGRSIDFKSDEPFKLYWIIDYFYELLYIQIKIINDEVGIRAYEYDAIFPHSYEITLHKYSSSHRCYQVVADLEQTSNLKYYDFEKCENVEYRLTVCPK